MSQRDAHESYAVAARRLHWIAAILAASLAAIVLLMYLLAHTWLQTTEPPPGAIPPEPRLQNDPASDLAAERSREQAQLDGYAWVDRDAGIARIPVDRAMDILARSSSSAQPNRKSR
jgi:cytochrome b561